jgi:phosphogluconate dehydratase
MGEMVNEKAIVNAVVGLLATGGSTNHAIHIPAMARAAGIILDWQDMDELSHAVPLIARVYPNGTGDVNHFHAAGGMGYVIKELLAGGLAHADILTIAENGMADFATEPFMDGEALNFRPAPDTSGDEAMLRPVSNAFLPDGGMRLVQGNLGRGTFKSSAVDKDRWTIEAPIRVFDTQEDVQTAFKAGELHKDVIVVVRFQGPRANGMPELHKLTRRSACFRTRASRWRWSPTGACRAHRARCPPPSTSRPRRWQTAPASMARWPICAMATSCASAPRPARWRC